MKLTRADRPDEWQMDVFIRGVQELEEEVESWKRKLGYLMDAMDEAMRKGAGEDE